MKLLVTQDDRVAVLRSLHDYLGHFCGRTTKKMVNDRFWWPKVHGDSLMYVKSCD